jgi:hypothetical protein
MLPKRGRPGQVLLFEVERELTPTDLLRLATDPTIEKVGPPMIQRLKANHHAIARYLASGRTVLETAELTGMTPQRVGDLQRTDPAFRDLLAYYQDQVDVIGVNEASEFRGNLRHIGRRSLEIIKDKLADEKVVAEMSVDEARRLAEMALGRTDAPPRTAQNVPPAPTQITFNMGPRKIEPGVEPKVIDHEDSPEDSPLVLEIEDEDPEPNPNAKGGKPV